MTTVDLRGRLAAWFRADSDEATEDIACEAAEQWRDASYIVDAAIVAVRAETREELEDALPAVGKGVRPGSVI